MYRVEVVPKAVKEYDLVPKPERMGLKKAILGLEKEPRGRQVKKLEGRDYYRLRFGDWRVIFAVSDPKKLVTILAIERRTSTTY